MSPSLLLIAFTVSTLGSFAAQDSAQEVIVWHPAQDLTLEGVAFEDTERPFDRLPSRAQDTVRKPVWNLSRNSAGLCVRFRTASPEIRVRWSLTDEELALPHMPATGVSGVDLYVRDGTTWRWLGTGKPTRRENNTSTLAKKLDPLPEGGTREYVVHFPLYNGTESLEIGIPAEFQIEPLPRPASATRPLVFYGTSITQGGCASRPGMPHTALLGRRLNRPIVNLGFSGNGRMEQPVTDLLAEIDAAAYVIDCLPNMGAEEVAKRTRPLVLSLRTARPGVPILLTEDRTYGYAYLQSEARLINASNRAALREAYESLLAEGVEDLYYLAGDDLLGSDGEATVDGSHPNDLGFMRQAEAFEPVLRQMLGN